MPNYTPSLLHQSVFTLFHETSSSRQLEGIASCNCRRFSMFRPFKWKSWHPLPMVRCTQSASCLGSSFSCCSKGPSGAVACNSLFWVDLFECFYPPSNGTYVSQKQDLGRLRLAISLSLLFFLANRRGCELHVFLMAIQNFFSGAQNWDGVPA